MKVFGISMVRNVVDVMRVNLNHHLSLGVDRFLIIDNGSCDGTTTVLKRMARRHPISWTVDRAPYDPAPVMTGLAREAAALGADWVVPIDGDEFWWAPRRGDFRALLAASTAGALRADVVDFVQRRDRRFRSPRGLLTMTMRPPEPVDVHEGTPDSLDRAGPGFVETRFPPKHIARATATLELARGSHCVSGVDGPVVGIPDLVCLHAELRSRSSLEMKAEHGRRVQAAGYAPGESWHLRRWDRIQREGGLGSEWRANSYREGALDVHGARRPLVEDMRLRDLSAPWVRPVHLQLAARLARRSY